MNILCFVEMERLSVVCLLEFGECHPINFISCSMIKADFEYIYVILLVGYYLYKAFKGKKDDDEVPAGETKKKKSVLEELMEELERQQKADLPKPEPAPAPVPVPSATVKKKSPPKRVVEPMPELLAYEQSYKSDFVHMESQMVSQIENNEIQVAKPVRKKPAGIRLGSTVLSPKDAIVAQVLFERKF